ncbi:odorant receptor 67c-like [Leptidea sinapis]|uniref:odorant receptor 67c-like n=1 Tax=Leptidea sinapis TaxID=189913 RepID=UPI0021C357B0|nr:odorant receptor 67c-like [Leptidea sinapis]
MASPTLELAKREIDESLKLSTSCMFLIGFSLKTPADPSTALRIKIVFVATIIGVSLHALSELAFLCVTIANSPRVEYVAPLLHTVGYGILSICKISALFSKRNVFARLLNDLRTIWPVYTNEETQNIKSRSLRALRIAHLSYFALNESGVLFYIITPVVLYLFNVLRGQEYHIRTVWRSWYPFDIYSSILLHTVIYIFEIFSGQSCVWAMICSDLLFSGMASHIVLILEVLQKRLQLLGCAVKSDTENYQDIVDCVKLHQKLIRYCNDLEDAFSFVNLINIFLSSVNICCVVFVIVLLEPLMAMSNKLFFAASVIQIGVICWYGENIIHANANVAQAAYDSKWYNLNPKCRRSLAFLIQRSQKPIAFTAMKFTNISLVTYSAILTRSYSYFALLYTMYSEN